ncbi:hypothetical protein BJV74DRAFT_794939 [Russula compacta]|nr:hypothetical protein BJV74DRAFT_794939 [Russula compacta]
MAILTQSQCIHDKVMYRLPVTFLVFEVVHHKVPNEQPYTVTFINITPLTSMGVTVVDLGEMNEGLDTTCSSSLPPKSAMLCKCNPREGRHKSLTQANEDVDENTRWGEEIGSDLGNARDSTSFQREAEDETPLHTSQVSETKSARIKKEKIKTHWFWLWSKWAITKPPVLHISVQLELGDLSINQFYSEWHNAQVIQIWLLIIENSSKNHLWKQNEDQWKWKCASPYPKEVYPFFPAKYHTAHSYMGTLEY